VTPNVEEKAWAQGDVVSFPEQDIRAVEVHKQEPKTMN